MYAIIITLFDKCVRDHYPSSVFQHLADICTIHNIIKDDLLTGVMY
jgi:hypothetical protein